LHIDVPVDIFTAVAGGETRSPPGAVADVEDPPAPTREKLPPARQGMPTWGSKTHATCLPRSVGTAEPLTDQEVNSIRELASSRPNRS